LEYEEIWITGKDETRLQGWFIYQKNNCHKKKTCVFFHENAGNIGLRLDFFEMSYKRLDCNWLVVAYRCYSGSDRGPDGSSIPNQEGIMIDADAISEYILAEPRINKDKVFGHGRSLGGAVVTHLAAKQSREGKNLFTGIVVESTFTSISDMADQLFGFLKHLGPIKDYMLKLKWDSKAEVGDITCPILFISGSNDSFVPTRFTKELF